MKAHLFWPVFNYGFIIGREFIVICSTLKTLGKRLFRRLKRRMTDTKINFKDIMYESESDLCNSLYDLVVM